MARQIVDIGTIGNDGTGDSIRESFRKVNENFRDLYAVFGQGDRIRSTDLDDFPATYESRQLLIANDQGDNILAKDLVEGAGIAITHTDTTITIRSTSSDVQSDVSPTLGGPLDGARSFPIARITDPGPDAVTQFNLAHSLSGLDAATENEFAITRGYADRRYLQQAGGAGGAGGAIRVREEPASRAEYTLTIIVFESVFGKGSGLAKVVAHGYNSGYDGFAVRYQTTGTAASGLTNGNTYYIKIVDEDHFSLHPSAYDAKEYPANDTIKINVTNGSGTGTQTLTDASFDSTLQGNWTGNEALPRESVVRRQGDAMTGILTLSDHPDPLAGAGTPNGDDDLQAATKFYVDNSSFASTVNLYVSTSGNNDQTNTPPGKEGRALAYAFRSLSAACEYAESVLEDSAPELGPYNQVITYNQGKDNSFITQITASPSGYTRLYFRNRNGNPVDQGVTNNIDIIPGKLLVGSTSGAKANIVYYYGVDGSSISGEDYMDVEVISGTFVNAEALKFGETVKETNITIFVESGIYYEDLPIRIPANVAIIGDEMRRSIIRPLDRISQSKWSQTPFYRDKIFDGMRVTDYTGANLATAVSVTPSQLSGDIVVTLGSGSTSNAWVGAYFRASQGSSNFPAEGVITSVSGGSTFTVTLHDNFSSLTAVASGDWSIYQTVTYGYHYLTDPNNRFSTPKNNLDMDVFLCNDSNIIRQVCLQGHGGFMMVLDPKGQILTKSPYCQQSSTFSQSINRQRFAGGQFVDGFVGNLTAQVFNKVDSLNVKITNIDRKPQVPCFFNLADRRFRVDAVNDDGAGFSDAASLLRRNKNFIRAQVVAEIARVNPSLNYKSYKSSRDTGYIVEAVIHDLLYGGNSETLEVAYQYYINGVLQVSPSLKTICDTAFTYIRNTAISIITNATVTSLQNDYTQVKDLVNPGEAGASAKITTLIDNTLKPIYNIGTGSAPARQYPTYQLLLNSSTPLTTSELTALPQSILLIGAGNTSMLSNDFTQINDLGYGLIATNKGLVETVSVFTYYCHTAYYAKNGGQIRSLNGSNAHGVYGLVAEGGDPLEVPDTITLAEDMVQVAQVYKDVGGTFASTGGVDDTSFVIYNFQYVPENVTALEIDHGPVVGRYTYEIARVEDVSSLEVPPLAAGTLLRIQLDSNTTEGTAVGLADDLVHDQFITLRALQTFRFYDVTETNPIRPSTALTFITDPEPTAPQVYRAISYASENSIGVDLQTGAPVAISSVSRTGGTATITTSAPHNLVSGKYAEIDCTITAFNDAFATVTVTGLDTFTYANAGGNVGTTVTTGTVIPNKEAVIQLDASYRYVQLQVKQSSNLSGNIAFLERDGSNNATVTLDTAHTMKVGERITITSDSHPAFDETDVLISAVTSTSITYPNTGSLVSVFSATGDVAYLVPAKLDATSVTYVERNGSNVATVTTARPHNLVNGDLVDIDVSDNTYDGTGTSVTVTGTNTFTYSNAGSLEAQKVVSGNVFFKYSGARATLGSKIGDRRLAISRIISSEVARIQSAQMLFGYDGKVHKALDYYDEGVSLNYGYVTFEDYFDLNSPGVTGLNSSVTPATNVNLSTNPFSLRVGLPKAETAEVLVNISTCRATGHDFLDIGSGGYNATNYPNKIYGRGGTPGGLSSEVQERTQGRVFWISTDQNGFFRVGRFFTVDQGTGRVSFSANIALSNLDGLGFKTGREIREFSDDSEFIDGADDAVPTENATQTYIDRRLGLNRDGVPLTSLGVSSIGPGYMDRAGILEATANLKMGGYQLKNMAAPTADTDAANKIYVTQQIETIDSLSKLLDVEVNDPRAGDMFIYVGTEDSTGNAFQNAHVVGDLELGFDSSANNVTATVTAGSIINSKVNDSAAIEQHKLDIANARVGNGIGSGLISFTNFELNTPNSGEARITYSNPGGIPFSAGDRVVIASIVPSVYVGSYIVVTSSFTETVITCALSDAYISGGTVTLQRGIANFDTNNFESTNGFVGIKDGGVNRIEMANIDNDAILGNISGSATFPQQVTPQSILKRATWNEFNSTAVGGTQYAYTFTKPVSSPSEGTSSFAIQSITTTGDANSLIKTDASGLIDVDGVKLDGNTVLDFSGTTVRLKTPGGVNIISATGASSGATPVTVLGQWTLGSGATLNATFAADLAEWYSSDAEYEPGTVLIFGGSAEVTTTKTFSDIHVAGIVSTDPAFTLNGQLEGTRVLIALQGRVPCKVVGKVRKGEMLTTAAIPGVAARSLNPQIGTIIGKALEDKDTLEVGVIEVAVGRV
jgi:hypothetical protein